MVFANPKVVERIKSKFIPVALKAKNVANPPSGVTGELYRELIRTQPAPQGICVMNSAGKVLDWVLSFDNEAEITDYFDHAAKRYESFPLAEKSVETRRFRSFPKTQLADIADSGKRFRFPLDDDNEPATELSNYAADSLVGKVIGRPAGNDGKPVARTLRQEDYMEATFAVSRLAASKLIQAVRHATQEVDVPDVFVRQIVGPAYLGQLDVSPLIETTKTNSRNHWWQFRACLVKTDGREWIRFTGQSHIACEARNWDHAVTLQWQGYLEVIDGEGVRVEMLAKGHEQLNWGRDDVTLVTEADARHLMAGHPIQLNSDVIYGLSARRQ